MKTIHFLSKPLMKSGKKGTATALIAIEAFSTMRLQELNQRHRMSSSAIENHGRHLRYIWTRNKQNTCRIQVKRIRQRLPRSFGLAWLYDSEERYHSTTWVLSCQEKNGCLQRYWSREEWVVNLDNVLENLPSIGEQTVDNITENTILINNQCPIPG
ncbi:hypothetical protein H4Q26_003464 [Puccinia striiformis f. sp. tritici PST-130]|nr:hypothetical protein H4Q26_003464 [Puccinia striiformis f. sp. tritici PST-130]